MNKTKVAIFPGSFDPLTMGHWDLIKRAADLFDRLIVVVGYNPAKKTTFSLEQRISMITETSSELLNVEVDSWDGLMVDYLKENDVKYIVRGIRNGIDFESERSLALMNSEVYSDCETVFLQTSAKYQHVSSTLVRQVLNFNKSVKDFVPTSVNSYILKNK